METIIKRSLSALWGAIGSWLVAVSLPCLSFAQSPAQNISAPLPTEAASWINTSPLSLESLEGKGVVLWFFEEQCPKCRAAWPDLMALAKKHEGEPVVFVAVNSGNPTAVIQAYAKQQKVDWPIIVDPSRQFEKAAGVSEISLQNICQARVITPDGKLIRARWDDVEGAAQLALKGAAWKLDPASIPADLRPAWRAIELGNYGAAGPSVKKGLASTDASTKESATNLAAIVQPKIEAAVAQAKSALDAGDKWSAYMQYTDAGQRFEGFDLPPEVMVQRRALSSEPQVKNAIQASKNLEKARKILGANPTPTSATRHSLETMLKQVTKDAPGTDIATQAEDLLTQLGPSGK